MDVWHFKTRVSLFHFQVGSTTTFTKSGNPGYVIGKEVIAGTIRIDSQLKKYLLHCDFKIRFFYCILLYCILEYIVCHFIVLYCIVLHYIVLHYVALQCVALYCIVMHCIVLHYIVLHYVALQCVA